MSRDELPAYLEHLATSSAIFRGLLSQEPFQKVNTFVIEPLSHLLDVLELFSEELSVALDETSMDQLIKYCEVYRKDLRDFYAIMLVYMLMVSANSEGKDTGGLKEKLQDKDLGGLVQSENRNSLLYTIARFALAYYKKNKTDLPCLPDNKKAQFDNLLIALADLSERQGQSMTISSTVIGPEEQETLVRMVEKTAFKTFFDFVLDNLEKENRQLFKKIQEKSYQLDAEFDKKLREQIVNFFSDIVGSRSSIFASEQYVDALTAPLTDWIRQHSKQLKALSWPMLAEFIFAVFQCQKEVVEIVEQKQPVKLLSTL